MRLTRLVHEDVKKWLLQIPDDRKTNLISCFLNDYFEFMSAKSYSIDIKNSAALVILQSLSTGPLRMPNLGSFPQIILGSYGPPLLPSPSPRQLPPLSRSQSSSSSAQLLLRLILESSRRRFSMNSPHLRQIVFRFVEISLFSSICPSFSHDRLSLSLSFSFKQRDSLSVFDEMLIFEILSFFLMISFDLPSAFAIVKLRHFSVLIFDETFITEEYSTALQIFRPKKNLRFHNASRSNLQQN